LAERYDFAVPPGMVEMEFNSIWAQYEADKVRQKEAADGAEAGSAPPTTEEGPIDAAALVAPEETALDGASERAPASAEAEKPQPPHDDPAVHHAIPHPGSADEPIDAAAIVAPEETALEGASDSEPAAAAAGEEDEEKAKT